MLPGGAGAAKPSVVGDVDKDLGSMPGLSPGDIGEDGFEADETAYPSPGVEQEDGVAAGRPFALAEVHIPEIGYPILQGKSLAERHQMALGIFAGQAPTGKEEKGGVEILLFPGGEIGLDIGHAGEDGDAGMVGEF